MAVESRTFTDAERMELRSHVELAGEAISSYWPMRTFIHHNPLHGLEDLPFGQAVKRGEQLLGGKGYLPSALYRRYFEQGRIRQEDVTRVLAPLASKRQVLFAGREISHLDLLRLSMVHGLSEAAEAYADPSVPVEDRLDQLALWLATAVGQTRTSQADTLIPWETVDLLSHETLSTWCDRTLGTSLVSDINEQMIKWCSAFLDEGEASWTMPDRQHTFYRAWKRLARYDASLRLLGVADASQKIDALGDRPEEAVLDSLAVMGIPKSAWESYFALHLSAMPGWTGYIKWRSEEQHHPWQARYPVDLVKYLAVRLFYEREFVALHCRQSLDIAGHYDAIRASIEQAPYAHWLRRQLMEGRLPASAAAEAREWRRLHRTARPDEWNGIGRQVYEQTAGWRASEAVKRDVRRLWALSAAMGVDPEQISETQPTDVSTILNWLDGFPAGQQSQRWLEAFEARHRRDIVGQLRSVATQLRDAGDRVSSGGSSRPLAQMVFCIDIRSEVLRRHLEQLGGYETLGVAGFFGIPVK
ncbi:MAG TPA: Na-translocating system protein MpsB, partial [Nitrospira sp.]|nr:Na-translocating system protein MpsB [Nitrospira sp.]